MTTQDILIFATLAGIGTFLAMQLIDAILRERRPRPHNRPRDDQDYSDVDELAKRRRRE